MHLQQKFIETSPSVLHAGIGHAGASAVAALVSHYHEEASRR